MKKTLVALSSFLFACPPSGPDAPPSIVSFSATPDALCAAGNVTLSFTVADATSLAIDHGVGDVSGLTSKSVSVGATTTFTLTASNSKGSTTAQVTVAFDGFPAQPGGPTGRFANAALHLTADRKHLAWAVDENDTFECVAQSCSAQPFSTLALSAWTNPIIGSLHNELAVFETAAAGSGMQAFVFEQSGGVFGAPSVIPGVPPSWMGKSGSDEATNRLSVVMTPFSISDGMKFAERVGSTWSVNTVAAVSGPTEVISTGYAPDGTPWVAAVRAPDVLTIYRRAGSLWSAAASRVVNGGQPIYSYAGAALSVSPDKQKGVFTWTHQSGGNLTGYAVAVDFGANSIGFTSVVMPTTSVSFANGGSASEFTADGASATLVYGMYDGRLFKGSYNALSNTFTVATPYHPENTYGYDPRVIRDSCGQLLLVSGKRLGTAGSFVTSIDAL